MYHNVEFAVVAHARRLGRTQNRSGCSPLRFRKMVCEIELRPHYIDAHDNLAGGGQAHLMSWHEALTDQYVV